MKSERYSGVIVKCNNQILLCKRNNKGSFPGMWSIPAGKIEENETTQEAAKREFFEETAIDIYNENLQFVGVIPRYTKDGKKVKGMMYVYLLVVQECLEPDFRRAKDGHEHTDWKYATLKEMTPMESGTYLYKLAEIVLK
jgi:ADP-ribose pyrophosphatase YjhB (NUDIX family)